MDVQNIQNSLKVTTFVKLVDQSYDNFGYLNYVFKLLDLQDAQRLNTTYIIATRYPNWDHRKLDIGEEGFLSCEEILEGLTGWSDGTKMIPYNYDHIHFIKFIAKKNTNNNEMVVLIN